MFDITAQQEIKITKGDDSGYFPLSVNLGTQYVPIQYTFLPAFKLISYPTTLEVTLDKDKFKSKATDDKTYQFEYNYLYDDLGKKIGELGWYLEKELVNMDEWGLTIVGTPEIFDKVCVAYFVKHMSEAHMYIFNINDSYEQWLVYKIFRTDGKIIANYRCGDGYSSSRQNDDIVKDGNLLLELLSNDTKGLNCGEYRYQIKIKIYDEDTKTYKTNTLTPPTPFYLYD